MFVVVDRSCPNGTRGVGCSVCDVGWDRIGGVCQRCLDGEIGIRFAIVLLGMVVMLLIVKKTKKKLSALHRKYRGSWNAVKVMLKAVVSFTQINLAMGTMMSDDIWTIPALYSDFLKKIAVVELDILPLLGIQCVIDMDFRYAVAVALAIPVVVVLLCLLGHTLQSRDLDAKVARLSAEQRDKYFSSLFDQADFDNSGTLGVEEVYFLVGKVWGDAMVISSDRTMQLMLCAGAMRVADGEQGVIIMREDFIAAVTHADGEEPPDELLCPIGRELFENPVMAADGHNYERKHIERWLQQANTSPKTNEEFAHQHLTQNHEMRARCLEWKEMREKARAGKGTGAGTGRKKREGKKRGGRRLPAEGVVTKTAPIVQKKSISSLSDAFPSDLTLRYIAKHHVFTFWVSGAAQMLFMFHAPVSSKAFLYFDCTRLGARSFLRADYDLECWRSEWFAFLPVAVILMFGFALALPAITAGYMLHHRKHLGSPNVRERVGFLMQPYRSGVQWWEAADLIRKMILSGMLIYLPPSTRTAMAVLICVIAVTLLSYFQPHGNRTVFWIAEACYMMTTLKFLSVTFRGTSGDGKLSETESFVMGVFLIVLDCIMYIGLAIGVSLVMKKVTTDAASNDAGQSLNELLREQARKYHHLNSSGQPSLEELEGRANRIRGGGGGDGGGGSKSKNKKVLGRRHTLSANLMNNAVVNRKAEIVQEKARGARKLHAAKMDNRRRRAQERLKVRRASKRQRQQNQGEDQGQEHRHSHEPQEQQQQKKGGKKKIAMTSVIPVMEDDKASNNSGGSLTSARIREWKIDQSAAISAVFPGAAAAVVGGSDDPVGRGGAGNVSASHAVLAAAAGRNKVATDGLPQGWAEAVDPATGKKYFFHAVTGVSRWERPELSVR